MRFAAHDEPLARRRDGVGRDGPAAVPPRLVPEAGVVAERVDQPRLASGQPPDLLAGVSRERLSRFLGVLRQQRARLAFREIPQAEGLGLDVEGAAAGDDRLLGTRMDAVVAHVADAAQDDALREGVGAQRVAGAQLTEYRQEGVADQRVDLVDEHHEWSGVGFRPAAQNLGERAVGAEPVQGVRPDPVDEFVAERHPGDQSEVTEDRPHGPLGVFAPRLSGLDVRVDAAVVSCAAAVQQVAQRQERRGLARLPRRVHYEVALVADERQHGIEIQPFQGRDAVVVRRLDGARGVEEAHGPIVATPARCPASPAARGRCSAHGACRRRTPALPGYCRAVPGARAECRRRSAERGR